MNKQGLDLHKTRLRSKHFQMNARNEAKHNSVDFGFLSFSDATKSI